MTETNEPITEAHEEYIDPSLCVNCKKNKFEGGHPAKLCGECRSLFIKYPIPKSIWIFSSIILFLMILGMVRMPKYFSAAYHLSRAEKAMDRKAYITGEKELLLVTEKLPDNVDAHAKLLICASYNRNYVLASYCYQIIEGKPIEDNVLYNNAQNAISFMNADFPLDTNILKNINLEKDSLRKLEFIFDTLYRKDNPDLHIAGVFIANAFYDKDDFKTSEMILKKILEKQPNSYSALLMLSATKRNLGDFSSATQICNRLLEINSEDIYAWAQMAKIEMKQKNDFKAAEYVSKLQELSPESNVCLEVKAMHLFFTNKKSESKQLWEQIRKNEAGGDSTISVRLGNLINGKYKYR